MILYHEKPMRPEVTTHLLNALADFCGNALYLLTEDNRGAREHPIRERTRDIIGKHLGGLDTATPRRVRAAFAEVARAVADELEKA